MLNLSCLCRGMCMETICSSAKSFYSYMYRLRYPFQKFLMLVSPILNLHHTVCLFLRLPIWFM